MIASGGDAATEFGLQVQYPSHPITRKPRSLGDPGSYGPRAAKQCEGLSSSCPIILAALAGGNTEMNLRPSESYEIGSAMADMKH